MRGGRSARLLALPRGVALIAALCSLVAAPIGAVSPKAELDRLLGEIEQTRERVGSHEQHERALLDELDGADRRVAELRERVRTVRAEAVRANQALERAAAERAEIEKRLAVTRRAMRARAVALYKAGEAGPLRVLFSADSLPDLLGRATTLRRLLDHDAQLKRRHLAQRAALQDAERRHAAAGAEQRAAEKRLATELAALQRSSEKKRAVLVRVRGDRTQERALLNELERAAHALEDTIAHLGEMPQSPGGATPLDAAVFAASRGRLPPPVDAPVAASFGPVVDERFFTTTFRKGVEFAEAAGAPVRACAAGDVRFAGWFRGYGRIVILHHGGDFFTVSGHLDEVHTSVGERVTAGQVIGTVGETGSLDGPSFYFEVRRGSQSLDPVEWLAQVRLAKP